MQNVDGVEGSDSLKDVKTIEVGQAILTPPSSGSPVMEKDRVLAALHQQNFMDLSGSDEGEASEVESFILEQEDIEDGEPVLDTSRFLLSPDNIEGTDLRNVDPETQARLEALLEAAGIGKLSTADGKAFADPEVLRRLTSSVSCALDEAAAALTRMRAEQQGQLPQGESNRSLAEACSDGDIGTVRKLLDEGRSVHETTEEGESLLSLACSAGYYELAQVLLAMRANVEDRGIKGDCTPLMEAASGGYVDIVKLLIAHEADVNAQSSAGNTPLHYAACGGYQDVVRVLIEAGANVEEHNENGHTPLMEAASAGHVSVAKILLEAGAGINTHSNEFKESALTLACYKGHLDMVKFLLEAGADQEHKTDEMHTALMEASMDGHVEVARLLLDSGAQVNMPADSFESPLTLAACGGHVELANLLIERGANLEEVNDEGYTPLMEAAREGHEEMVALLLAHGADINAQTEETQETALTLACCGGFLEVADFLIKAGADIELGCSTPLMEAAQEGHLDLVKYLLKQGANVHAQTGTGDTALTYACENGHTDVADVLLQQRADLEHESEGGRTPLMKAARAGHLCTVQFLISKGADVNRQTTNNDHTVLSLACAGGHLAVVELLLAHGGDPTHKLKDGSTMLIEGAKGGHTQVVNLLLDYPNSILSPSPDINQFATPDSSVHMNELPRVPMQGLNNIVPPQDPDQIPSSSANRFDQSIAEVPGQVTIPKKTPDQVRQNMQKAVSRSAPTVKQKPKDRVGDTRRPGDIPGAAEPEPEYNEDYESNFTQDTTGTTAVATTTTGAVVPAGAGPNNNNNSSQSAAFDFEIKADMKTSEKCEKLEAFIKNMMRKADMLNTTREEQIVKKQQILEELKKVERELQEKAEAQQLLSTQQQLGRGDATPGAGFSQQQLEATSTDKSSNSSEAEAVAAAAAECQAGVDMEGVANGLTVIDQLIDSIVIDLDVPFNFGPASGRGGSDADNASSVNEKLARLLAKQESTGSLDSISPANLTTENIGNVEVDGVGGAGDPGDRAGDGEESATPNENQPAPMPPQPTQPHDQPLLPHDTQLDVDVEQDDEDEEDEEDDEDDDDDDDEGCGEEDDDSYHEEDEDIEEEYIEGEDDLDEEDDDDDDDDEEDDILRGSAYMGEEHSSRASSEEVDLTNVVPATEKQVMLQQVEQTRQQQQQHTQDQLAVARAMLDNPAAALALAGQIMPVPGLDQETLQQLQTLPLHTVLEQSVAAATSTAAALDQQHQQLQQQRQQLQAQLALQQQLQVELQQQLKLQQEHQQLQQQLKAQQALTQQMEIQQLTNKPKFQAQFQNQAGGKVQPPGAAATATPQPVVNLQQLQAHLAKVQPQLLTAANQQLPLTLPQQKQQQVAAAAAQQAAQLKGQQPQPLQQVEVQAADPQQPVVAMQGQLDARHQQELQQQLTQVSRQVQQLQASQQLTQQELLAQAQQLQQQLQQAQQLQQLAQQKQVTQHLTQQDLLHQAQQLQQQLQQAQHLQQLAQQQKQFSHIQGAQKKSKKKLHTAPVTDQSSLVLPPPNQNQATFTTPVTSLPGTIQESVTPPSSTPLTPNPSPASPQYCAPVFPAVDLDAQTESNHDTALTLACAGGHVELVSLLLSRGADIEHRDKKGFTPLILAATAGHADVVEMLLDHGADIEAQSERTKDTPLSLACSGGRYEVVELLLARGANKEHRNVSDYTPLSLAASGGYVNIIKLLLSHGAEINSRTGSKLGISPLMLAAMNGHTAAVKLLLDMGSDINAQIETNRNTALTLACFQGRHEVVSLLVDRKANIEHRAKTGLTPLMEAASGGYVEVGRVLLDKGADVNAPPVPSSRDTALTIAADKGHYRFVELLLSRSAAVDVKNKKGNSPLWLACNGGHLDVVQLLVNAKADIDSQDNRKVSCLIAAFRKGHVKVIKWMVKHVAQFPSDPECMRYISTITDKELLKKCHQCMEIIVSAKDRQAAEANRHASILLEQLDREKSLEESKKAAAARKREKRRRKKKEKQEQAKTEEPIPVTKAHKEDKSGNNKNSNSDGSTREKQDDDDDDSIEDDGEKPDALMKPPSATTSTTTGIPPVTEANNKNQAHKRSRNLEVSSNSSSSSESNGKTKSKKSKKAERERDRQLEREAEDEKRYKQTEEEEEDPRVPDMRVPAVPANNPLPNNFQHSNSILPSSSHGRKKRQESSIANDRHGIGELDDFGVPSNLTKGSSKEKERNKKNERASKVSTLRESFNLLSPGKGSGPKGSNVPSPKKNQKKEEGWKEVTRKSKKVTVPSNAISRVIGRGGSNINAIREVSGAHIDVDKQKGSGDRIVVIKGSAEATRQAHNLISSLIKDPDKDLDHLLPKQHQRNSTVYQNNNNNSATPSANNGSSLLPTSSASSPAVTAGVTTCAAAPLTIPMTQIFSTSVWHNNMASHLSSSASPVPSSLTASQAKAAVAASKAAAIAVSLAMTTSQLTAPFANVVRQSHSASSHRLAPSGAPMGAFQTGPVPSSSSPKRPSSSGDGPAVSSGSSSGKSPSVVSRRLFQGEKCANATAVKTSVTYSTVSMAKTKVVTATSQTFASKVDNSVANGGNNRDGSGNRHNGNGKSQAMTTSVSSPTPGSGKSQQGQATNKQPADPQPLPIKTSMSNTRLVSSQSVLTRGSPLVSVPPSDYSPFNSRFSQLDMLGKKEEDRMNFASVAAAGVIPTTSSVIGSVSPAPLETHPDPNLPAKAPGYKAPNQRTSSPHVVDSALSAAMAEAQQRHAAASSSAGGLPQAIDVAVLESQMKALAHTQAMAGGFPHHPHHHHHHHASNHQTMSHEADPSKAPGYKGGFVSDYSEHRSSSHMGGFRHQLHSSLSPRPSHFSFNSGPFSLLSQHATRDEYSTPDQPMTLPKIESTLNPNAPDFTSRSYEPSGRFSHMSGLNMGPGFVPGYGSIGGLAGMSGVAPPTMGPVGMHTGSGGGGFRVQPPSGGVLNQQSVTPLMSNTELLSQGNDMSNNNGQVLPHMANAGYMSSGAMTVQSSMARQFKNMPPSGPSSSTTPPVGASSKGESPIPAEPSPASSSAPSPTDHPGLASSDAMPRPLRPIGTERAYKKPQVSGFSIPESGAAGLWSFNSDLGPEWMSAMTSAMTSGVMTSGVMTSGVMTPGLSADGEDHVGPQSMPPPMMTGPFPTDSHMDPSVELAFGPAAVVFANGGPAGAAAALPLAHMYTQAPMTVDRLPSMWGQPVKGHPDPVPQDPKLVRPHFSH